LAVSLPKFVGVEKLSTKIKSIIESVQKQVAKVVEWVIGKANAFSKKVGHKPGEKGEANPERDFAN